MILRKFLVTLVLSLAVLPSHGNVKFQSIFLIRSGDSRALGKGSFPDEKQQMMDSIIGTASTAFSNFLKASKGLPDILQNHPVPALVTVGFVVLSKLASILPNKLERRNRELIERLYALETTAKKNVTSIAAELQQVQQKYQRATKSASDASRELKAIKTKYSELELEVQSAHSSMNAELQTIQQRFQKSAEAVSEISYELELARNQYFELQQEAQSAQSRTRSAHEHLQQALTSLQSLESQVEARDNELAGKDNQIFDLLATSHQLEVENMRAKSTAAKQSREIEALNQEIHDLQHHIEDLEAASAENDAQLSALRDQLMKKDMSISKLQNSLSTAKAATAQVHTDAQAAQARAEAFQEQLHKALDSIKNFETQVELKDTALANQDEKLLDLFTTAQHLEAEFSRVKGVAEKQSREIEAKDHDIRSLQNDVGELKASLSDNNAQVHHLQLELAEKEKHASELQQESSRKVETVSRELADLKATHQALNTELLSTTTRLDGLSAEYATFKKTSSHQAEELLSEIERYHKRLSSVQAKLRSTKEISDDGLTLLTTEVDVLTKQVLHLENECAALQEVLKAKDLDSAAMLERSSQIEAEASELKAESEKKVKEIALRERKMRDMQAQLKGLYNEYMTFKSTAKLDAAEHRREIEKYQNDLKAAQSSLKALEAVSSKGKSAMKSELDSTTSQLQLLRGSYAALQAELQVKDDDSAALLERTREIEAEAAALRAACEKHQDDIAARDRTVKELQAQLRIVKELKDVARLAKGLRK